MSYYFFLLKALKRYEQMHSDSTSTDEPMQVFEKSGTNSKYKYVYAHAGASGLGNRMLGIVSAFLLALLTDRVLIVYSPQYDFNKLLCDPFPHSKWILPREVKVPGGKMIDWTSFTLGLTNFYTIDEQIIQIKDAENYFLAELFWNKHLMDKLNQLFPSRNVGTVLFRYLIHPSNEVWAYVLQSFGGRHKDALTIGLQIRDPMRSAVAALKCLPPLPDNTHVFIASLGSLIEEVKTLHPSWQVTQRFADGAQRYDIEQMVTALHDIFLLSMCDKVVISVRSTFGYLIMALKGSVCPIAGNDVHDHGANKDACSFPNDHEVCHHPGYIHMKRLNDSGKITYRDDLYPAAFTGPCVDFTSGIRLNTARD